MSAASDFLSPDIPVSRDLCTRHSSPCNQTSELLSPSSKSGALATLGLDCGADDEACIALLNERWYPPPRYNFSSHAVNSAAFGAL